MTALGIFNLIPKSANNVLRTNRSHGLQNKVHPLQINPTRLTDFIPLPPYNKNRRSAPAVGRRKPPLKEILKTKTSAGRMGCNPYDPLTTTNFEGVDHG